MAVDRLKRDFLSFAQKYKDKYKLEGGNPDDLDEFKRYMDIYFHLELLMFFLLHCVAAVQITIWIELVGMNT